jgi:hypothetical protein
MLKYKREKIKKNSINVFFQRSVLLRDLLLCHRSVAEENRPSYKTLDPTFSTVSQFRYPLNQPIHHAVCSSGLYPDAHTYDKCSPKSPLFFWLTDGIATSVHQDRAPTIEVSCCKVTPVFIYSCDICIYTGCRSGLYIRAVSKIC